MHAGAQTTPRSRDGIVRWMMGKEQTLTAAAIVDVCPKFALSYLKETRLLKSYEMLLMGDYLVREVASMPTISAKPFVIASGIHRLSISNGFTAQRRNPGLKRANALRLFLNR